MSVLKIFKELTPKDWDVLDNAMDEENKIENVRYIDRNTYIVKDKPNFILIRRSYPEKIVRTFCKCGFTSGNDKNNECPKCGNKNAIELQVDGKNIVTLSVNYNIVPGDPIEMKSTEFIVYADTKTSEFVFEKQSTNLDFTVYKDMINYGKVRLPINNYSFDTLYNSYVHYKEDFEYYYDKSTSGFLNYIKYRGYFPVFMSEISKYPNIVNTYCKDNIDKSTHPELAKLKKFEDIFKDIINCPNEEIHPHMEKLFTDSYYNYRTSRWSSSSTISLNIFENYDNLKTDEMKQVILYIIAHGHFTGYNIRELINNVTEPGVFDKDEEALFANFFMANYISDGTQTFQIYKSKKKNLIDWGYKPIAANLEKRNFNIIKNLVELEERGYNPKKASFFMENFELDPLSSLKYLDSRRAPNKEMKNELLKKVD